MSENLIKKELILEGGKIYYHSDHGLVHLWTNKEAYSVVGNFLHMGKDFHNLTVPTLEQLNRFTGQKNEQLIVKESLESGWYRLVVLRRDNCLSTRVVYRDSKTKKWFYQFCEGEPRSEWSTSDREQVVELYRMGEV